MTLRDSSLGIVLAGGASTRMGVDKALIEFGGRPLVAQAIARLSPQVGAVAISANGDPRRFATLGLPVLADAPAHRGAGPLAGIAAALAFAEANGRRTVVTLPCDAPFAPLDLASRLAAAMAESQAPVAVAEGPRGLEPLFALWRSDIRETLDQFLDCGGRSAREFLAACEAAQVRFSAASGADPFANINDRHQLAAARARLAE